LKSGYYLASSSKDATIKLWDLREGRLLYTLKGHAGATNGLCFSKDGHFLASGGADQLVMVWKSGLHWEAAPQPDPEHDWTAPVVDKRAKIDTTDKR
jgi:WD40 repeat protein